jgi:hypothetical protein
MKAKTLAKILTLLLFEAMKEKDREIILKRLYDTDKTDLRMLRTIAPEKNNVSKFKPSSVVKPIRRGLQRKRRNTRNAPEQKDRTPRYARGAKRVLPRHRKSNVRSTKNKRDDKRTVVKGSRRTRKSTSRA